jgi:hypothetical protein
VFCQTPTIWKHDTAPAATTWTEGNRSLTQWVIPHIILIGFFPGRRATREWDTSMCNIPSQRSSLDSSYPPPGEKCEGNSWIPSDFSPRILYVYILSDQYVVDTLSGCRYPERVISTFITRLGYLNIHIYVYICTRKYQVYIWFSTPVGWNTTVGTDNPTSLFSENKNVDKPKGKENTD